MHLTDGWQSWPTRRTWQRRNSGHLVHRVCVHISSASHWKSTTRRTDIPMGIGRVGVWTMAFDTVTWKETQQALESLEQQGWGTVWLPEAFGREALSLSALSLS